MTQTLPCNFVGDFKIGDNLVYNCSILCKLVENNVNRELNKMIVIQISSIVEAALGQVIYRAQHYNNEGVPNISSADQRSIKGKKIDKFNTIIDVLKKYNVLDDIGVNVYDDLHKLRRYRNKIHIQEDIEIVGVSRDEPAAFSNSICTWAINLNVRILEFLCSNLARPTHIAGHVLPLEIPTR